MTKQPFQYVELRGGAKGANISQYALDCRTKPLKIKTFPGVGVSAVTYSFVKFKTPCYYGVVIAAAASTRLTGILFIIVSMTTGSALQY